MNQTDCFAAYCMGDASILSYGFIRGEIYNIIEKCNINTETFVAFSKPWDILISSAQNSM